jgi:hypothetical protein
MLHRIKHEFIQWFVFSMVLAFVMPTKRTGAQEVHPPDTVGNALRSLASRSGVAFVGQVQSIKPKGGVVEIVFCVDQAILGSAASSYTLREWSGLWPPGQHRYAVGQRVLIFLHQPGAAGLSTPVDGMTGIIPIVSGNTAAANSGAPLLDTRRLAANLQRSQSQPLPGGSTSGILLSEATQIVSNWRQSLHREPILQPLPLPQPSPIAPQPNPIEPQPNPIVPQPIQPSPLPSPVLQQETDGSNVHP